MRVLRDDLGINVREVSCYKGLINLIVLDLLTYKSKSLGNETCFLRELTNTLARDNVRIDWFGNNIRERLGR